MEDEIQPVKINDLNKTQLIMLAILLSFVVSIATGIVTVTLMQQASPAVNQTINRVVQQTIEKVVPDYSPTKTQTVIVKEDDLVVDAISKTRGTIAKIFASKDATDSIVDAYNIGDGMFIVAPLGLDKTKQYILKIGDASYEASVYNISSYGFGIVSIIKPDDSVKKIPTSTMGNDSDVKAGQTIAIIGSGTIVKGTVQAVVPKEQKDEAGKVIANWNIISSSVPLSADMIGQFAVNLDGNVVGVVVAKGESSAQILGIDSVTKFVADSLKIAPAPKSN